MSSRFVEATPEAGEVLESVRETWFNPVLGNATIKILFDTKLRKHEGKIVLGRILKANDLIRRLTDNLADEGCDYILFLDKVAFTNIPPEDKVRLVRHELRHCKVTGTIEKPKYSVIPHDIEDFEIEIKLNEENIGWARNAAQLVSDIYEQFAEQKKEREKEAEKKPLPEELPKKRAFFMKKQQA
jgi:hypothetical protein